MDAAWDLDEIEEVNANCILMANLQQATTSATVSKSISLPNEEFSDDTSPSVARKFLNEEKSTIVTLQRVVKQKMTLDIHNWSSTAHQEEAAKFVRDFKSLAKEADESLAKHKALEFEIECLLRAVVSQDLMSIMQSNSVVDTSNLQTELDLTKEKLDNCIIKKEKEYDVLWNNWYTKCEECKYDKISYDKAYNDMQQKIERLQAQLGDLKGTSTNTKFANQSTKRKPSLQSLRNNFVVRQPNAFQSERPKFSKTRVPRKVDDTNDLSNPVTSNSVPTPQESKVVKNDNVIAPGMFRINSSKTSRKDKFVPINKVRASVRTNPITVSQPHVITKKEVISDSNGLSSTGVDNTAKTRRPQPRSNTKNDRNKKHMSSESNNIKLAIRNDKSEVVYAMCKQCFITANHDVCVLNYVNGMNSHGKKQKANVLNTENQKKHKPKVTKPKKVGSKERLSSPKPSKPKSCLRWSPTGRIFYLKGKIVATSEFECQSDCSNGDNACTSNP
ncbi:hypothetical protein Tco_0470763 [Tanacetum coccineum]